jgi:hypothetical protein
MSWRKEIGAETTWTDISAIAFGLYSTNFSVALATLRGHIRMTFYTRYCTDCDRAPRLEFPIRCLDRLVLVRRLVLRHLLVASPVHSLEAFGENRVRVVEARVEPVGIHA